MKVVNPKQKLRILCASCSFFGRNTKITAFSPSQGYSKPFSFATLTKKYSLLTNLKKSHFIGLTTFTYNVTDWQMKLTRIQHKILRWLARGWGYPQIAAHLGIRLDCVHVHAYNLRKRLGVSPDATTEDYKRLFAVCNVSAFVMSRGPSAKQKQVLRLIAHGHSYVQIGSIMRMCPHTAQDYAVRACKRIGIVRAGLNRNKLIREWWFGKNPMDDPMFQ